MSEITETKNTQENIKEFQKDSFLSTITDSIGEKFPIFEILDLDSPETKTLVTTLEKSAYEDSGYGDNTEGENHFSRINEYSKNNSLALGVFNENHKKLLYYIHFTILSPRETVFQQDNELYTEGNEQYLILPGLVFNKILKDPTFIDSNHTGSKLEFFLIQELLKEGGTDIRIEEQCQPDSYRFFKQGERRNRLKLAKDIQMKNNAGVDVHKILAIIYNEKNIEFLKRING